MPDGQGPSAWSTALPDWETRIRESRSLIPDLPLFETAAARASRLFRRLRVPDLPGTPTYGEVCEPWVLDLVAAIFGAYDPDTRKRMLQEFFLLIPKKNGKTAISAAIIVVAALVNERPNAELLLVSETQEIARIAFKQARGIIQLDPDLDAVFHVQEHRKMITHRISGAEIKILSADGDVVTGSKASVVLIDELHVLGAKPKAADIMLELRGGLASRPEGFLLIITTQSKQEPQGEFKRALNRARAVRDGTVAARMLPVLYEFPRDMQQAEAWRDPATWALVNPNLERSVSVEFLKEQFEAAEDKGADALALFASQHLNVEIGLGLHSERWTAADKWDAAVEPELADLDVLLARVECAVVGGDLGGADDLASLVVEGRCRETARRLIWARAWCFPDALKRQEIAPKLQDLADAGELIIDADPAVHVAQMAEICDQIRLMGLMPSEGAVGLDPWGVAALTEALIEAGFDPGQIMGVGQGWKLTGAIKGIERRLLDRTLRHGGQALMRWAVGNAKAEAKGNNVYITKAKAGTAKIDPLVALFNASQLMDRNPQAAAAGMTPWDRDPAYRMVD